MCRLQECKTMRQDDYDQVSEVISLGFTQEREKTVPITGPTLTEKTLAFNGSL